MNDDNRMEEETSLCFACGFCCDGTIFANAPVRDSDNIRLLEAMDTKFFVQRAKTCFELPCPAYAKPCCQIYVDRPAICQEFSCKLLDEYCEQKISMSEAQEKINRAISLRKSLLDTLQRINPSLPGMALPKLWRQWDNSANGDEGLAFRQKHGAALMQMAVLRWYLWEHFYGEENPGLPSRGE